jgi:hypothetical protein
MISGVGSRKLPDSVSDTLNSISMPVIGSDLLTQVYPCLRFPAQSMTHPGC